VERDRLYAAHRDTLDDHYFLKGQRSMENLEGWARGRGTMIRPSLLKNADTPDSKK
jgi:hypothetical protein